MTPPGDNPQRQWRSAPSGSSRGTFVKTNSIHVIEILGLTSLDFVVIDAEHAPFDRSDLDRLMLAARSVQLPALVRIADASAAAVMSTLDMGAAGLLVPHVDNEAQARELVARTRCRGGVRGFSSSTRAAGYGALPMARALDAVEGCLVVAQIESAEAVEAAEAIAAVDGIDGLFVGRADLALSMGEQDARHPRVLEATRHVLDVARNAGKLCGMAVGNAAECDEFGPWGANWFIVGSDQSLLRQAAQAVARR